MTGPIPPLISREDVRAILGIRVHLFVSRLLAGGTAGHPLDDVTRYRWHPDTDSYTVTPRDDLASLQLFRRHGEWRVRLQNPEHPGEAPLFQNPSLNDPIYTPVALLYAIQVASRPSLRAALRERLEIL